MVNQLGKFIPNLAEMTKPLWDLVSQNNAFVQQIKQESIQFYKRNFMFSVSPVTM